METRRAIASRPLVSAHGRAPTAAVAEKVGQFRHPKLSAHQKPDTKVARPKIKGVSWLLLRGWSSAAISPPSAAGKILLRRRKWKNVEKRRKTLEKRGKTWNPVEKTWGKHGNVSSFSAVVRPSHVSWLPPTSVVGSSCASSSSDTLLFLPFCFRRTIAWRMAFANL